MILRKLEGILFKFRPPEIRCFMDEFGVKINSLNSSNLFFRNNFSAKHFGQSLMSKTNAKNLQFWIISDGLFQRFDKVHNLWGLIINRKRATRQNNCIQLLELLYSRILPFQDIKGVPVIPLVVKNPCEQPNQVHFGLYEVCSQL